MIDFELLVFCFVIIETIQVFFLLRTNHKTKELIEKVVTNEEYAAAVARNMLWGLLQDIQEDEEKQKVFIGFMAWVGHGVVSSLRGASPAGNIVDVTKGGKIKPGQGLGDLVNQGVGSLLENLLNGSSKGAAKVAEKAVEGW